MKHISEDQEFYNSLTRTDEGGEETDQEDFDENGDRAVCSDEIDSSKTINEATQDALKGTPANCLSDIYADKEDTPSESDTEDKGGGVNLDIYVGHHFSMRDATNRWMEWDGE